MLQNAENPNFGYMFLTNLHLGGGGAERTGSPLLMLQPSPNADLSLRSPSSLGSQSTKSCLRNGGLTNCLLSSVQCSFREAENPSFAFCDRSYKAKKLYHFADIELVPWLLTLHMGGCCLRCLKPVVCLRAWRKLFARVVNWHFRSVHAWLHSRNRFAWIAVHMGAVRWDRVHNLTASYFEW